MGRYLNSAIRLVFFIKRLKSFPKLLCYSNRSNGYTNMDDYSRTSVMWTPEGRTKSVHNSEVSTLVKLGVATGHRSHNCTIS